MAGRAHQVFSILPDDEFIGRCLAFADTYSHYAYFNPNHYNTVFQPFGHLLMIGSREQYPFGGHEDFRRLHEITTSRQDYYYCHLNYDLKNQCEDLSSDHPDSIGFPVIGLHAPEIILKFHTASVEVLAFGDPEAIIGKINRIASPEGEGRAVFEGSPVFTPRIGQKSYLEIIDRLKAHIVEGDIYEINFCQEFVAENAVINPVACYRALNRYSPAPFSCLYKNEVYYLIGASPERFLKKSGNRLLSQPIKGTTHRGKDSAEDEQLKYRLRNSEKEMAENMMIVDLVRNDLSKSCLAGSVKVEEMFGIYTFPAWHQMISTVSGMLKPTTSAAEAIKNAFPMGSMTGAPKIKAMQLIERYEKSRRGLYSGAFGYFLPDGDFDFNVTIRSLIYNADTGTASFQAGSAITYDSDPHQEYRECLLKAEAFRTMFDLVL